MGNNDTKLSPTNILNRSYDPGLDVLVFEQIGADGVLKNPATEETQLLILAQKSGGIPANKATDAYGYQAYSETATHGYTFKEDGAGNWYIARETLATGVFDYAKGTGGYASVYVNSTSAPSSGTFASYDATFENVGASSLEFDADGNLKVSSSSVDPSDPTRKGEFDNIFSAPIGIDVAHHEIHEGRMFTFCEVIALANGASQDYIITTPDTTKWAHFGYVIDFNDGAGTFAMYGDSDRVGTTLQTAYNRNRNSANTPTTTVKKNQTGGTTDGDAICMRRAGSGKTLAGIAASGTERVLKQNSKYLIRLTNNTTSTNNISVEFTWYEHTNE